MDEDRIALKVAKVAALPQVAAWLEADERERLKRLRALEMLAFAHTEAWKPRKARFSTPCVLISESSRGQTHLGRAILFLEGSDGYIIFTAYQKRFAVRMALLHEALCLLYPPHRVRPIRWGMFSWLLYRGIRPSSRGLRSERSEPGHEPGSRE